MLFFGFDMNYELISTEEYENLPEDDELCFVEFEAICRRNMNILIDEVASGFLVTALQAQYMASVSSVAGECGLANLAWTLPIQDSDRFQTEFSQFSLAVQGEVARIRIRGRRSRNSLSVQLTANTRTKIEHYISRLREMIDKSELADSRKKALHDKLDEFIRELGNRRLSFGKTMLVLSAVLAAIANTTTLAAEGPDAITHIMNLIGADKESEDAASARLASTPKALPAPKSSHVRTQVAAASQDAEPRIDDDIPF